MNCMRIAVLSIALLAAAAAGADGLIVGHHEPVRILALGSAGADGQLKPGLNGSYDIQFDALGRTFDLQLETNDGLFSAAVRAQRDAGIAVYKGQLTGLPDSWVRLTMANGQPRGLIRDGDDVYAIEAPGDSAIAMTEAVIFRLSDTYLESGSMSCGAAQAVVSGDLAFRKLSSELGSSVARAPGASVELGIAALGDFEFSEDKGANAEAAITTRLNNVDGIFSEHVGVQISVEELNVFTTSSDPFTNTSNAGDLLDELGVYRQTTIAQFSQGLSHLYTGRNLDGSTVGIAYTDTLCSSRFGAGLTQGTNSSFTDSLVAAHEIGHNFGAPHDGVSGACEAEPQTFIMAPSINGSDDFSACSVGIMSASASSAVCVSPLPTTDMTIELAGQAPTPFIGGSASMNFDATNLGSTAATNVEVDISIPSNFSFVSAGATSGSCTSGAGTVNCALGSISGGSTKTVSLSTVARDTNSGTFVATVSADTDDNMNNNQETVVITPVPAPDMTVTAPGGVVIVDQSTLLSATIENLNPVSASNVTVSITLNAGLRADSASWADGACTVAANQVDCQAASVAGSSSKALSLTVTGVAAGAQPYNITLATSSDESDTSNNSAAGTVTVNTASAGPGPGGGSGSGGGGAFGLWFLLVLKLLVLSSGRCRFQARFAA